MRRASSRFTALVISVIGLSSVRANSDEGEICALSEDQERVAIDAFHTMAPIFKEPRCVNCHGTVDAFKEGGGHLGGVFPRKTQKLTNQITGEVTEEPDPEASMKVCHDCHSLNKNWFPATNPEIDFINKSEEQLCLQMKNHLGSPNDFVDHMTRDPTNFIPDAFEGTRALDDNGIATYENATGKDYVREPPKISHAMLIEQARAWADAVGEKNWEHPPDCGCVPHKNKAKITQRWTVTSDLPGSTVRLESQAEFLVDLTFKPDGTFSGTKRVPRDFAEHVTAPGGACEGKGNWVENWSVMGNVDPETHDLTVKVRFDSLPGQVQAVCGPLGAARATRGFSSDSVSTPLSAGFQLPAKNGAKQHFEWSLGPGKNTVDVEYVKVRQ
jgi:hypothetical protein